MGLRELLPGTTEPTSQFECRNCGTTLEEDDDECPCCGSAEIAEYTF